jgi:hypothetical protein
MKINKKNCHARHAPESNLHQVEVFPYEKKREECLFDFNKQLPVYIITASVLPKKYWGEKWQLFYQLTKEI